MDHVTKTKGSSNNGPMYDRKSERKKRPIEQVRERKKLEYA
jgi:hypothetical protein